MATYTSLQYIQSNGEQYIDTEYGFTGNDYLHINFSIVKAPHYQKTANTDLFSLKARVESGETESAPLDCDCRTGSGTQTYTYIYLKFYNQLYIPNLQMSYE